MLFGVLLANGQFSPAAGTDESAFIRVELVLVLTQVLRLATFGSLEVDGLDCVDAQVGGLPLGRLRGFGEGETSCEAFALEGSSQLVQLSACVA